jgi:hypothetical protein
VNWLKIIVHHSLTKDSGTVTWGAIRNYHLSLGWTDIGYHAGVELVTNGPNADYEVLMGRPWDRPGAHAKDQNHDSLGICFIGNYDLTVPPEPMLIAGAKLIALWMRLFQIDEYGIYGHSDFSDKSCPGTKFPLVDLIGMTDSFR